MTKANPFLWPKKARLAFYNGRGKCLWRSLNRKLDLADELMLWWTPRSRTVYFGLAVAYPTWGKWDSAHVAGIEDHIRYDLGFDGYWVTITRCKTKLGNACTEEFRWKLVIRVNC